MTEQSITGEQVWDVVSKDPDFLDVASTKAQHEAIKPFFMAAPEVLAHVIDKPVTLESLNRAKLDFLRYASQNGFFRAVTKGTPDETMIDMFEPVIAGLISMMTAIAEDVPAFLKENDLTEEEVILGPAVGLNRANIERYRVGTLTIGQVLLSQPMIIFKNN